MKNRDDSMEWIPLWIDKWIFGSTRIELQPDERAVWTDFMALASKDNGYIRANPDTEYLLQQLAGLLCITEELLNRSIQRFIETKKIAKSENGAGYYILNWATYQLSDRHKRRFEENKAKSEGFNIPMFIKCPIKFDSMKTLNGLVRSSRLLVAIALNRALSVEEEVHHINRKDDDDKIKNLMLFQTHKDHTQYEHEFKIKPIFDGSSLNKDNIMAIMAEFTATIGYKEEDIKKRRGEESLRGEDKNIKNLISSLSKEKSTPNPKEEETRAKLKQQAQELLKEN